MAGAVTGDAQEITLADGAQLPLLGLGVWQVPDGRECVDAVRWALELGYRHIDTAQAYGNEESVGAGTARERRPARAGVHHHQVQSRTERPGRRGSSAASSGSGSSTSTCTSSTRRGAGRPGRGRGWSALMSSDTPARSGFPTSTSPRSQQVLAAATHRAGRQPGAVQSVRVPEGPPRRVPRERDRARGVQPARNRPPPCAAKQRHGSRSASGALRPRCCSAGASSVAFR